MSDTNTPCRDRGGIDTSRLEGLLFVRFDLGSAGRSFGLVGITNDLFVVHARHHYRYLSPSGLETYPRDPVPVNCLGVKPQGLSVDSRSNCEAQ
ncbi:hypothetical protein D8S78_08780 [Natrialba swarupiae]|nr:hypothetical protein [Natrialba swarupiae]